MFAAATALKVQIWNRFHNVNSCHRNLEIYAEYLPAEQH